MDRNILKGDFIRCSPSEISTINTPNSQIHINIPKAASVIRWLKSYIGLSFDVLHAATNDRYADIDDIRLVNLGPTSLFSFYKLTSSSRKPPENIEHDHIACLMYKVLTTGRGCDVLSIGFDRSCDRRQRELTKNKNVKVEFHDR